MPTKCARTRQSVAPHARCSHRIFLLPLCTFGAGGGGIYKIFISKSRPLHNFCNILILFYPQTNIALVNTQSPRHRRKYITSIMWHNAAVCARALCSLEHDEYDVCVWCVCVCVCTATMRVLSIRTVLHRRPRRVCTTTPHRFACAPSGLHS